MPHMPVYLGLNAMSITVTEFYYTHLSQSNTCHRLISLCVSNEFAFDNGLWLASHVSKFNNLRRLSLIDIKCSSFELIINALSPNTPLIMFSIRFTTYARAAETFAGVPEGAYYQQIFRLFPYLRVCDLRFWRYIYDTLDNQIVLPFDEVFMPIETSIFNLQSIVIQECSPAFLSHLLEHLPQLQDLSFGLSTPWLPDQHPLMNDVSKLGLFLMAAKFTSESRRRLALVIGIGDYENVRKLKNPQNDAKALSSLLQRIRFTTAEQHLDKTRNQLKHVLVDFEDSIQSNDIVLFYFAGHGIQWEDQNYLLPKDFPDMDAADKKKKAEFLKKNAINAQDILNTLSDRKPYVVIFLLDCCRQYFLRNTDLNRGALNANEYQSVGLTAMHKAGSLVAFACAPGALVDDKPEEKNSLFMKHLLKHLPTPNEDIVNTLRNVTRGVMQDSNSKQIPFMSVQLCHNNIYMYEQTDDFSAAAIVGTTNPTRKIRSNNSSQIDTSSAATGTAGNTRIDSVTKKVRKLSF
ncbi:unnamed protein product [Rotaria socialis]